MAEEKKYYWIKLRDTFLTSDAVDFLMGQKNGSEYVVLYQMLCLKTANTGGEFVRTIGEVIIPYDADKIQRDCKYFSIDTVHIALTLYKKLALIYEQKNGVLKIANFNKLVGDETKWAKYKQEQRERERLEKEEQAKIGQCPTDVQNKSNECPTRDKILDTRNKDIKIQDKDISTILPDATSSTEPNEPIFISLSLISDKEYPITNSKVSQFQKLYKAVDVEAELRKMQGWLLGNPKNRKTKSGIMRFVTNWLSRAQDKAKPSESKSSNPFLEDLKAYGGE